MTYVDGYVLPIPTRKKAEYKKLAKLGAKVWKKHGALHYFECWGDDLTPKMPGMKIAQFQKIAGAKKNENIVFAFIVYKNKTHRNKVNKAVMKDPLMNDPRYKDAPMPFDPTRMVYGGFTTIVEESQ